MHALYLIILASYSEIKMFLLIVFNVLFCLRLTVSSKDAEINNRLTV